MLESVFSLPFLCAVLGGALVCLLAHFGNSERKLYEELIMCLLVEDQWCYAEDLVAVSNRALKPYKVHVVLGGLCVRGRIERSNHGPDNRSLFRKAKPCESN